MPSRKLQSKQRVVSAINTEEQQLN